jgi:hypothetical protein
METCEGPFVLANDGSGDRASGWLNRGLRHEKRVQGVCKRNGLGQLNDSEAASQRPRVLNTALKQKDGNWFIPKASNWWGHCQVRSGRTLCNDRFWFGGTNVQTGRIQVFAILALLFAGCGGSTPTPVNNRDHQSKPNLKESPATPLPQPAPSTAPQDTQKLHSAYEHLRTDRFATQPLPQSGFDKIVEAIADAKPETKHILVPITDEVEVLVLRCSNKRYGNWVLSCNALVRNKPRFESFSIHDTPQVRALLRYYGSEWIRSHREACAVCIDPESIQNREALAIYCGELLWWNSGMSKQPDGNFLFETGEAQNAGHGLHIVIAPAGDLVAIQAVFSPE